MIRNTLKKYQIQISSIRETNLTEMLSNDTNQ